MEVGGGHAGWIRGALVMGGLVRGKRTNCLSLAPLRQTARCVALSCAGGATRQKDGSFRTVEQSCESTFLHDQGRFESLRLEQASCLPFNALEQRQPVEASERPAGSLRAGGYYNRYSRRQRHDMRDDVPVRIS